MNLTYYNVQIYEGSIIQFFILLLQQDYLTKSMPDYLYFFMEPLSNEVLEQEGFIISPRELSTVVAQRFKIVGKVGEGSFGMVFCAIDTQTGKKVALKKIKLVKKQEGVPASALREIAILKSLSHDNIVKIFDVFYDYEIPQLCFVMDYHPHTLFEIIKQQSPLPIRKVQIYSFQILRALNYMHGRGIIHRDLKPHNFLLSKEGDLKLCDFGQAKYTFFKFFQHTPDISTLWYRAPQILLGSQVYDQKIDVWAVGCIIAQLLLGKPLFLTSCQISLLFTIFQLLGTPKAQEFQEITTMKDFSPRFPKFQAQGIKIGGVCEQALDLLRKMLVVNPSKRISIAEALSHQFLLGLTRSQNDC